MRRSKRWSRGDDGFSIVELIVVIIILAVLAAIAISVFLGQREKAAAASAKQTLRNANVIAEAYREDGADYPATAADWTSEARTYTYIESGLPAADDSQVSVTNGPSGDRTIVVMATPSLTDCYYLRLDLGGTQFRNRVALDDTPDGSCKALDYVTGPDNGWD